MHIISEVDWMINRILHTPYSKIHMDDEDIIHYEYLSETEITLKGAKTEIKLINKLCNGKKVPLLVNLSKTKSVTKDAREYYSGSESAKVKSAAALIVNSPLHKIMGNFFWGINKPPYPVKLFTSEEKAINWLKTCARNRGGINNEK